MLGTTRFPRSKQRDGYSCGARCVYKILRHFGFKPLYRAVKEACRTSWDGTPVLPMIELMRTHGLGVGPRTQMTVTDLKQALAADAVVLVHVDGDHFSVVHGWDEKHVYMADPWPKRGNKIRHRTFRKRWGNWGLVVTAKAAP